MYKLVISDDEGKTTVVPLIRDEVTIGRKEGNTIRLTDRNVSRSHARLVRDDKGSFVLGDQRSRNGTKVNGDLLGTKSRRIKPGDQITIGDYSLSIRTDVADGVPMGRQMDPGEGAGIGKVTPHARLVMLTLPEPGREIDLTVNLYVVGRSDEANLRIEDPSISRAHARMDGENHQWTISDLDSINGVSINGTRRDDYVLKSGDVVELGTVRLKYVAPGEPYDYDPGAAAGQVRPPARRSRLLPVLVGLGVLAVAAIVLIIFFLGKPGDDGIEEIGPDDGPGNLGFDELIERGKDRMQAEDWAEAARYFARASTISPDSTVARDLRRLAQSEMEAQAAHQAGSAALAAFEWHDAMEQFASIPRSSRYSDRSLLSRAAGKVCEELLETSRLASLGGNHSGAEDALARIDELPEMPENCAVERDTWRQELKRRRGMGGGEPEKAPPTKPIDDNPYETKPKKPAVDNPYASAGSEAPPRPPPPAPSAASQAADSEKPPAIGTPGTGGITWDPIGEARKALDRGDTAGAIKILERGGNSRPVLSMLAQLYLQQGDKAGYERVARKFVKLYPNDPKSDQFRKSLGS
jgi:pSer/pThr/pTyr-binding forkhead associated (FHA) protein